MYFNRLFCNQETRGLDAVGWSLGWRDENINMDGWVDDKGKSQGGKCSRLYVSCNQGSTNPTRIKDLDEKKHDKVFKFSKYDLSKYKLISELSPTPPLPFNLDFLFPVWKKGILERCQFIIFRNFYLMNDTLFILLLQISFRILGWNIWPIHCN